MLVSAIVANAGDFHVLAVAKISPPASEARSVVATMPADADALALRPPGNTGTELVEDARDLVSWNARILNSRPQTVFRKHVTVANATGLHFDAHLSYSRRRNLALDDLEIGSSLGNLGRLHWCYCDFRCCHDASYEPSSSPF